MVSGTAVHFSPLIASLSKLGTPLLRLLKPAPLISLELRQSKIPQPYLKDADTPRLMRFFNPLHKNQPTYST